MSGYSLIAPVPVIITFVNFVQLVNTSVFVDVTEIGNETVAKLAIFVNALLSSVVTLFGIVSDVIPLQPSKAFDWISINWRKCQ